MSERQIKEIFVHCSDSPDDLDIGFKEIDSWHRENGWLSESGVSCGYHYIVRRDGRVQRGRPDDERGTHVRRRNSKSIGIVWIGRNNPTPDQYQTLLNLIAVLRKVYSVPVERVLGHYEAQEGKTCPNLDMNKVRADLLFTKPDSFVSQKLKAETRATWI